MPNLDVAGESSRFRNYFGPVLALCLSVAIYLGFAHFREWPPFPHQATTAELSAKADYEQLSGLYTEIFGLGDKIDTDDTNVRLLQARHYGKDPETWGSQDRKKLDAYYADRKLLVKQFNEKVRTYNTRMQAHGYPFTIAKDIPVIVKNPVPLLRSVNERS